MRVSTKGRYALRIMIDLAEHKDEGNISLKDIAERQGVSLKYLESIAAVFQKEGYVVSHRGKSGGYCLAKSPAEYTIGDILKLSEGSMAPVKCLDEDEHCDKAGECITLPLWEKLDAVIDEYLQSVTLQDLIDGNIR